MQSRRRTKLAPLVSGVLLLGLLVAPATVASAGEEMDSTLVNAFSHLGFNEYDSMEIINRSLMTENYVAFNFAAALDPPSIDPAEAAWGAPTRMGVTWVSWPDATNLPSFPPEASVVDGALYLPRGGPTTGTEYALMWVQMGGPIPVDDSMELFQNWSFPFNIPGQPTWDPLDQFPYDTWGGASVIPYVTYGPQPWFFGVSRVQEDGSLFGLDFEGFGLIYGDMIILGVDRSSMFPNGIEGITFSFAGHIHDGGYGATADSRSLVTFATGEPGTFVAEEQPSLLEVGTTTAPSTTTTTTQPTTTTTQSEETGTTSSSTDDTVTEAGGGETAETADDGEGLPWWIWLLAVLGIVVVAYIGRSWFVVAATDPCADLLTAWEKAQQECDEARAREKKAKGDCDEATEKQKNLERQHRNICVEWPPACEEEGASAELSGDPDSRTTSRDQHARRIALGRLWDEYRAGNVSAQEVEQAWERANTREFRDEMRKQTEKKKAERDQLEKDIKKAKDRAKEACDEHAKAKKAADEACEKAEAAKKAYDDCVADQNAEAFVDAVMTLGSEDGEAEAPETTDASPGAAATETDPLADRKMNVPVPITLDKAGLSGNELERAERLEGIFQRRKGTGDLAATALDLYQFNEWHKETFGEPWYTWSTEGGSGESVTETSSFSQDFMQTRVMACYEFVHFVAFVASDQLGRQRIDGDDDTQWLSEDYSVDWGFDDDINTNTTPLTGNAPRGSVITGVYRWGDYNNSAGYYHTGVSIGNGKIISLGSDGLILEDATGTVGGCFPSVGYSEVNVGDYAYGRQNPAPTDGE